MNQGTKSRLAGRFVGATSTAIALFGLLLALSAGPAGVAAQNGIKKVDREAKKAAKADAERTELVGFEGSKKKLVQPSFQRIEELKEGGLRGTTYINLVQPDLPSAERQNAISSWTMIPGYAMSITVYVKYRKTVRVPSFTNLYFEAIGGDTIYRSILPSSNNRDASPERARNPDKAKNNFEINNSKRMHAQVYLPWEKQDRDYYVYDDPANPTIKGYFTPSESTIYLLTIGEEQAKAKKGTIKVVDRKSKPLEGAHIVVGNNLVAKTDKQGRASIPLDNYKDNLGSQDESSAASIGYKVFLKDFASANGYLRGKEAETMLCEELLRVTLKPDESAQEHHLGYRPPSRTRMSGANRTMGRPAFPDGKVPHAGWPDWAPAVWKHSSFHVPTPFLLADTVKAKNTALPYLPRLDQGVLLRQGQSVPHVILSKGQTKPIKEAIEKQNFYEWSGVLHRGPNDKGGYNLRLPRIAGTYFLIGQQRNMRTGKTIGFDYFRFVVTKKDLNGKVLTRGHEATNATKVITYSLIDPAKEKYKAIYEAENHRERYGNWFRYYYPSGLTASHEKGDAIRRKRMGLPKREKIKLHPWPKK